MTRLSPIGMAALALSASAGASVITVGGGYAEACFEAAEAQDISARSLDTCNQALREEALLAADRVATHVNRGIIYLRRNNVTEATADFDTALALNPNQPEAWLNKAILFARHRDSRAALPLVAKALEYGTKRPEVAYFVRAMAHEDSGNLAAAYRDLQTARNLAPEWREPAVELARYSVRRN